MPGGMSGYELAQELKRRPGAKVVLTSGFPGNLPFRDGRVRNGQCPSSKPYRKDELTRNGARGARRAVWLIDAPAMPQARPLALASCLASRASR